MNEAPTDLHGVDFERLSPRAQQTLVEIARPIAEEELTYEQVAERIGQNRRYVAKALDELAEEMKAQLRGAELPRMTEDEFEVLKADIAERGQIVPILYDQNGKLLDGAHRLRACTELGLTPKVEVLTVDEAEARALSIAVNVARRHLSNATKRKIVESEVLHNPKRSDLAIARIVGVDHKTVSVARRALVNRGYVRPTQKVDTLGRSVGERVARTSVDVGKFPTPTPEAIYSVEIRRNGEPVFEKNVSLTEAELTRLIAAASPGR